MLSSLCMCINLHWKCFSFLYRCRCCCCWCVVANLEGKLRCLKSYLWCFQFFFLPSSSSAPSRLPNSTLNSTPRWNSNNNKLLISYSLYRKFNFMLVSAVQAEKIAIWTVFFFLCCLLLFSPLHSLAIQFSVFNVLSLTLSLSFASFLPLTQKLFNFVNLGLKNCNQIDICDFSTFVDALVAAAAVESLEIKD